MAREIKQYAITGILGRCIEPLVEVGDQGGPIRFEIICAVLILQSSRGANQFSQHSIHFRYAKSGVRILQVASLVAAIGKQGMRLGFP